MVKVPQTVTGTQGDCFRACLASLLEKPIEDIPLYVGDDAQWQKYWSWLQEQGYELCWWQFSPKHQPPADEFYILSVASPTLAHLGLYHAVVAYNGQVVWDPHPERDSHTLGPVAWFETLVKKR